jgi:hypothetical protein
MMKRLLVVAALAISTAFASAQSGGFGTPVNLSFRVGFVYSLDDFTRDIMDNMIGVGAEYYLDRSLFEGGETTLSFDWMGRGLNGDKGNMFPIMLNQRWYVGGDFESANRRYYYIGAGIAVIDVVSTNTVAAARVGIGQEMGQHIFGELTLVYSDSSSGARATSVGAYVGYRF